MTRRALNERRDRHLGHADHAPTGEAVRAMNQIDRSTVVTPRAAGHDPLCPFAPWPDEDCYQRDAGVRICDLIHSVRTAEGDSAWWRGYAEGRLHGRIVAACQAEQHSLVSDGKCCCGMDVSDSLEQHIAFMILEDRDECSPES